MRKTPPIASHLAWLSLVVGAFFAGPTLRNEEPTSDRKPRAASLQLDDSTVSSGASRGRNPTTKVARFGTSSRAGSAPDRVAQRIASTLDGILSTKAANQEQLSLYVEECRTLIEGLNVENAPSIAETLEKKIRSFAFENKEIETLYQEFYRAWGALDGANAIAFNDGVGGRAQIAIVEAWAKSDLEAAMAYAIKQRELGEMGILSQSMLQRTLVESLAVTNLDDAIAYSMTNELESAASGYSGASLLAEKILQKRGVKGIESWFSLVEESFGRGEAQIYRKHVAVYGLETIGKEDPVQARELLVKLAANGVIDSRMVERITSNSYLATGPEDELSLYAMASPANGKNSGGYMQLVADKFGDYLKRDFDAAGVWLAKQPRDSRNDGAIQQYALEAAGFDQEAARIWVSQISDERLREATLARPEFNGKVTVVSPR